MSGQRREKVTKERFRFATAIIEGIIVRERPTTRYANDGQAWTEASVLVDLYDPRQKAERERPAFVRVKAFGKLSDKLAAFDCKNRIHAAGRLLIEVWETGDGELRESYALLADDVSAQAFPTLEQLLGGAAPHQQHDEPAGSSVDVDDDDDIPF